MENWKKFTFMQILPVGPVLETILHASTSKSSLVYFGWIRSDRQ
jgi:hypothetical protein